MSRVLANLYLEPAQREFLGSRAKANGTNVSAEARSAIDLYQAAASLGEIELLALATCRTAGDLAAINTTLDAGLSRADLFFEQIESIKARSGETRPPGVAA